MNWWGDVLSGVAAVVLTLALVKIGDTGLAVASGALLALGKFGSAAVPEDYAAPKGNSWPTGFRLAVLASRVPALAMLALVLARQLAAGAPPAALPMPAVMLVCYLLWARADVLLLAERLPLRRLWHRGDRKADAQGIDLSIQNRRT